MLLGGVFVKDLRAKEPEGYVGRELAVIERIVIHHVGGGVNRDYTAEEIADYHVRVNVWPGIGYHFLAHPDGRLEYVGDLETIRYHVGQINAWSVGICLAGDFTTEIPRWRQMSRVRQLCGGLFEVLGRRVPVVGHRDVWELTGYGFTECPGETWAQWRGVMLPWMPLAGV